MDRTPNCCSIKPLLLLVALLYHTVVIAQSQTPQYTSLAQLNTIADTDSEYALKQAYASLQSEQVADPLKRLDVMVFIVVKEYRRGQFELAQQMIEQTYPLARTHQQSEIMSRMENITGMIHYRQGELNQAIAALERSEQIAQQAGNGKGIVRARVNKGIVYQGGYFEPVKALELNMETLALAQEFHYGKAVSYLLNNLSETLLDMGITDLALEYAQESLAQKQLMNDKRGMVNSLRSSAAIHNQMGMPEDALAELKKALTLVDAQMYPREIGQVHLVEATSYRLLGHFKQAESCYLRARPLFEQAHAHIDHLTAILGLAELYLEHDMLAQTRHWLERGRLLLATTPELEPGQLGVSLSALTSKRYLKNNEAEKAKAIVDRLLIEHADDHNSLSLVALYELSAEVESAIGQGNRAYQQLMKAHNLKHDLIETQNHQLLASMQTIFAKRQAQDKQDYQSQQQLIDQLLDDNQALIAGYWQLAAALGSVLLLIGIYWGVIRLKRRRDYVNHCRQHIDRPSGLNNRHYISELIPKLLQHDNDMGHGRRYSMLLLKIDNLESAMPETKMHEQLIQRVSTELLERCSPEDSLARWSGESFLIVSQNSAQVNVEALATQLLNSVRSISIELGFDTPLNACMGIIHCTSTQLDNTPGHNWMDMIHVADVCQHAALHSAPYCWVSVDVSAWKKSTRYLLNLFSEAPQSCIRYASIQVATSLLDITQISWPQPQAGKKAQAASDDTD